MSDSTEEPKKKKKGGGKKMLLLLIVVILLLGGGIGGGLYAAQAGLFGGGTKAAAATGPQLVPIAQEKRASGVGGEVSGGSKYASSYYALDKEFTSNLQDSVHFVQVGVALSTNYDDRVIENVKTHEIAVRSAILMALGNSTEEQVFTVEGKHQLQKKLTDAVNQVLKEKEGFGGISNVYFTSFIVQ